MAVDDISIVSVERNKSQRRRRPGEVPPAILEIGIRGEVSIRWEIAVGQWL